MTEQALLGPWVRRFLLEHLAGERNLARNTQRSYRDTLCLLIPFAAEKLRRPVDRITVSELSADLVRRFPELISRKCGSAAPIRITSDWRRSMRWRCSLGNEARNISPGAVKCEPCLSRRRRGRSLVTSTSQRWMRCWRRPIQHGPRPPRPRAAVVSLQLVAPVRMKRRG